MHNFSDKDAKNIRYWFYHSLESWNPFDRTPSAASGLGLCTLQLHRRRQSSEVRGADVDLCQPTPR